MLMEANQPYVVQANPPFWIRKVQEFPSDADGRFCAQKIIDSLVSSFQLDKILHRTSNFSFTMPYRTSPSHRYPWLAAVARRRTLQLL
jgi:hypothetical protein